MDYVEYKFGVASKSNSKVEAQVRAKEKKDRIERMNRVKHTILCSGGRRMPCIER